MRTSTGQTPLAADVFFEVLHRDTKMQPGNYPVLQDTEIG
jgi:hypothetical protein